MRLIDNDRYKLRFYRAVDFDLHITEIGVMVDALTRFFRSRRQYLDWPFIRSRTINESRHHDTRSNLLTRLNVFPKLGQLVDRITQVANGCDTRSDVEIGIVG